MSTFQRKIILLIAVITIINFIDRSSISFAIQSLEKDFGITNAEFGTIAAAFGIGYLITTLCGGVIVDKFGTVGTWAISAVAWSIATMLLACGKGFWSFFWLRILLGIAEGVHFPALVRTVTDWIPSEWRARATALGLFGIPFSSIIGAPLITYLIDVFNWQTMFIVLGMTGVVWSAFWLLLFRKQPETLFAPLSASPAGAPRREIPWKKILLNPTFQASCAIYFAFGYTVFFGLMWLPGYLAQMHGASIRDTGYLVLPPWIASAFLLLAGGWISDYLWKKTSSLRIARSCLMGTALFLSGLCFMPIAFSDSLVVSLIWMSLGLGLAFILHPPIYSLNADLFGPFAGVAQGITSGCFALAGILSPSLTGWITQITGSFQGAFFLVTAMSLVTSTIVLLFQQPDREECIA